LIFLAISQYCRMSVARTGSHLFAPIPICLEDYQMSVRKRTWRNRDGSQGEAWIVAYTDYAGKRRIRSFQKKREADAYHASVATDLRSGVHVPDSQSITVAEAGRLWLQSCEAAGLERSTVDYYRQHLDRHIVPLIGTVKLSRLSVPMVREFEDTLLQDRSPAMLRKARTSLGSLLTDAQERGLVGQNVVRALRARRRRGKDAHADARQKRKLRAGVDIPSPAEIRAIIAALVDLDRRALVLTAIFTGLRSSELRGLRWEDVDLNRGELHVRQRADRYKAIGKLKSAAGERVVPLTPMLINTLRKWRLACPKGEPGLVFPDSDGGVEGYNDATQRALIPAMLAAGVTVPGKGGVAAAKYGGWHSLRHFYASWCINRRVDGGLELPPKMVQERLGHASITITMDVYGHLFPRADDGAELAAAEQALLA
jgi:integrase